MCKYKDEQIIKSEYLKDIIAETKSRVVWNGSVDEQWNDIVCELYNFMDKSFFIGIVNDYSKDCGWYIKLSDIKPLLESIYKKIDEQYNYQNIAKMMNKYNCIIKGINAKIDEKSQIAILNNCNNKYCIFCLDDECCHLKQELVESNNLDCKESIRVDYYEITNDLKDKIIKEIKFIDLDHLLKVLKIIEE